MIKLINNCQTVFTPIYKITLIKQSLILTKIYNILVNPISSDQFIYFKLMKEKPWIKFNKNYIQNAPKHFLNKPNDTPTDSSRSVQQSFWFFEQSNDSKL